MLLVATHMARINYYNYLNSTTHINNYNNSVNFAIEFQNTLSQTPLPPNCTLRPLNPDNETCIIVDFVQPGSNHTGHVVMFKPDPFECVHYGYPDGFVRMMCSIDSFNGYYLEITVNSLEEIVEVIAFSQNLLQYQPGQMHLDYVRVPYHLLNHRFVLPYLRTLNMNALNFEIQNARFELSTETYFR
jgi:hypothetical protein